MVKKLKMKISYLNHGNKRKNENKLFKTWLETNLKMKISCLKHCNKPTNENKLFKTWL